VYVLGFIGATLLLNPWAWSKITLLKL
jgi:hypothetical protein